jgi:hypothetical protein
MTLEGTRDLDIYSVTLGLALGSALVALCLVAIERLQRPRKHPSAQRAAFGAGVAAILLSAVSTLHHVVVRHPPGSPSSLTPLAFVEEHPALFVAAGMAVTALVLLRIEQSAS